MSQQTQSRGGWMASFMIVGAVLVLGLLAGLYYLKSHQVEDAASDPVSTETEQAKEKDTAGDDTSAQQAPPADDTPAADHPADDEANDEKPAKDEDGVPVPNENLPETGPTDAGAQAVALVALGASGAAYIQSRRSSL